KLLYEAQVNKKKHITKKLNFKAGQSLLSYGSSRGHLNNEAAKQYNVRSLGITLSEEQYRKTLERVEAEGLVGQVDVKLMDYRDLMNENITFDRIVRVGMLEHVGHEYITIFMVNTHKLLKEGGVALLHCITGLEEVEGNEFLTKYIFPGGAI